MKRQLPKNVRQIGNVSDSSKIYIEDYVDTFFNQLCEKAEQEMVGAFLIGETVQEEEQDYIYVYGAIQMKELKLKGKEFVIEDGVWKNACETCKEFFGDAEILGWFIVGGEHSLEVNHNISKLHQKYFPREKSLFITKNARDKEEKYYIYKYRNMLECSGHYVYYEKNVEMQNYMISTRKKIGFTPSEFIEDRVTKNFRSIVREKAEKNAQKNNSRLVYTLSTFLVLVILIIGVTMLNNYDNMKKVQNSLDGLSQDVSEKEDDETVETVGGNLTAEQDDTKEPSDMQKEEEPSEENKDETQQSEIQTPEVSAPEIQQPEKQAETYVVQKGDTLEIISRKKYGDVTHVEAICELNGLTDGNLILIGQKLLLP